MVEGAVYDRSKRKIFFFLISTFTILSLSMETMKFSISLFDLDYVFTKMLINLLLGHPLRKKTCWDIILHRTNQ